jgi:hypothetical protein
MTDEKPDNELILSEITEFCSMISPSQSVGPGQYDVTYLPGPAYVPERGLLAAILVRAVNDLAPEVPYLERISAINWFTGVREQTLRDARFSFEDIISFLDLGELELRQIRKMVKESMRYEAIRPKGIT